MAVYKIACSYSPSWTALFSHGYESLLPMVTLTCEASNHSYPQTAYKATRLLMSPRKDDPAVSIQSLRALAGCVRIALLSQ